MKLIYSRLTNNTEGINMEQIYTDNQQIGIVVEQSSFM